MMIDYLVGSVDGNELYKRVLPYIDRYGVVQMTQTEFRAAMEQSKGESVGYLQVLLRRPL